VLFCRNKIIVAALIQNGERWCNRNDGEFPIDFLDQAQAQATQFLQCIGDFEIDRAVPP
jgi:hypothetical protein